MALLAQTVGDSASPLTPLREMVQSLDAAVPAYDAQTIESFYAARVTSIGTVMTRLIGGMGLMGMTLTMVGLYGLVSYSVSRRTREIGIRVAIGATSGRVLRMILFQGLMPAGAGMVVGIALSGVTTRALSSLVPLNQQSQPAHVLRRRTAARPCRAVRLLRARPASGQRRSKGGAQGRVSGQPTLL